VTAPVQQGCSVPMAPDLKQIAALFHDCIEAIRNERHENLHESAVRWLKEARYELMRQIEAQ
jgi:HD superfamily phosphodiesterase